MRNHPGAPRSFLMQTCVIQGKPQGFNAKRGSRAMLKRFIKLPVLKLNKHNRPVVWFLWTLFYLLWQERENTLFPHCLHSAAFIIHYILEQICSEPPLALHHHHSAPSNMIDKSCFMSTILVGASAM